MTVASSVTSSRGREEPKPDLLSPQVCQPGLFAGVVHGRKIRRSVTLFEHYVSFLALNILDLLPGGYRPVSIAGPSLFRLHELSGPLVAAVILDSLLV